MRKGASHIDFAMALSVMVVVIAFSMFYITNYFSRVSPNDKNSELRSSAAGMEKILFESSGIPQNWENNIYAPVRAGLKTDLKRIAIAAAEKGGANHSFEEADLHVVFDANCFNTTYNNSIRIYDRFMNETPFRIYNSSECAANSGFLREANIDFLFNITGNTSQVFWLYYTNNTAIPKKSAYNFSYDPSLVGYWKFDSVNASNYTLDSTGNHNDGKLINYSCDPATCNITAGLIFSAISFNGTNSYVNAASLANMGVSVSYWKKNGTDTGWYHIANSSGTLYVNGAAGSGQKIFVTNASGNVVIGKDVSGNYFNGTIDEVRIYNRTLSAEEIKALYNYTRPNYIVSSGTVPAVADKKISALQNLSYTDVKNSLDLKGNFNITACEYSFGRHVPDTVNVLASSYPFMIINSSGSVKPCLASVNVW
ncbi:MAG: LamG domain-containing protein [Candidatus Aenigmatarchaeota archaeon]